LKNGQPWTGVSQTAIHTTIGQTGQPRSRLAVRHARAKARIGLAVPGRPIGPWSRRTGAPEASATRRDRKSCRESSGLLPTRRWSPRTGLTLRSRRSQRRHGMRGLSSLAVPQACHSQRSLPVHSGQPRTTTKQPRPAPFPAIAGDSSGRTGFGSRWSVSVHSCSVRRSAMKSSATFVP
jgi:hypothetical protein